MQEADDDAAYDAAAGQGLVTWHKPIIEADWAQDGYGGAGTIDDLSDQAGRPIEINQFLDDGLPNDVSFVAGIGTSEVEIPMSGGDLGAFASALRYFSPFRTDSPIYGYERDVAPMRIDTQLVTPGGLAAVRVFTGQMVDTPVRNGRASVVGMSAARLALAKVIQPPARVAVEREFRYGLTTAWPVVWALNECGIYAAPPEVPGCLLWVPLHGSGQPFIPGENMMNSNRTGFFWAQHQRTGDADVQLDEDPTWVDGPYVGAFEAINRDDFYRHLVGTIASTDEIADGDDWLSTAGNRGRVQFYVRGDAVSVNDIPGGVATWLCGSIPETYMLAGLAILNGNNTAIFAGVDINRHVFVEFVESSTLRRIFKSATTVVTDTFTRVTASGWGTSDSGHTYTSVGGAAGDRSTTGTRGEIDTNTTATDYVMAATIGSPDQEGTGTIAVSALPASGSLLIGLCGRFTDSANFYRGEMQIATSGAITARIQKRVANVTSVITSVSSGFTYIAATTYRIRFQVIGTTIRLKFWPASVIEPSAWLLEVYDDTSLTTGNLGGFYCRNDSAATTHIFSLDDLSILDLSTGQIPTDEEWHFVGTAWDIANNKIWTRLDDTLTTHTPSPAMSTAGLPSAHSFFESDDIEGKMGLPGSDLQFSSGADASPDVNPTWIHDAAFWTQSATVTRSILDLEVVAIEQPQEAWAFIGGYAQSELAMLRTDENDRVQYLTLRHWATAEGQTVAQEWSTATNSGQPDWLHDVSKIRNSARVEYNQIRVDDILGPVVQVNTSIPIPPGTTFILFATSKPATRLFGGRFYVLSEDQVNEVDLSPPNPTYVVFNTDPDGFGTYADPGPVLTGTTVYAEVIDWTPGQVLVEFTNLTGTVFYTVHSGTAALNFLQVGAYAVQSSSASATVDDDASIAVRGRRALPVQLSEVQSDRMAIQMAGILVGDLANPLTEITELEVMADARRQPGDLVTFTDSETGLDGQWRLRGVRHILDGANYRQRTTLRKARLTTTWDTGLWDQVIWSD